MIRIKIFIGTLLLFVLVFGGEGLAAQGGGSAPDARIETAIRQARDLLDSWRGQGNILEEAKEILDRVLKREPKNYHALKELARYHIMNGYLHSKQITNGRNVYTVGQFKPGTLERAEGILRSALRINPNYAEGYILLGHVYTQKEKLNDAREALAKAEAIGTNDPWLHLNWAAVHTAVGELEAASNRYQVVLKSGTKNKKALVAAYSYQIEYYRRLGEFEKVNELFKILCEMEPAQIETAIKQAEDLLDSWSGQHDILDQAKEILDRVLKREPENYRALMELARYHLMNGYLYSMPKGKGGKEYSADQFKPGTLERAEGILRSALRINPNYAEAYIVLADVYTQKERLNEARHALAKAEAIGGTNNPWLHLNWAAVHIMSGEFEAAANRCQVVLKSGTKNKNALVAAYGYQIEYYSHLRQFEKASDLYKIICEMEPTDAWVRGNYADLLRTQLGRYDEALAYAREALRIMNYGIGRETLAMCLYAKWADLVVNQKKPASEAQKYFDEAFRLSPDLDEVMAYEGAFAKGKALVQLLKKKGVSIDARAEDGSTALIIASNTGRADAVKILLSLGANPNARANNGWTPLLSAADEGYQEVVKLLLEGGADPNQKIGNMDAAMFAQRRGRTELATLIRQYAARPKK